MLPSLALPTLSTDPLPLETVLQNGALAAENGQFDAVLARAGATAAAARADLPELLAMPVAAAAVDGILPESGKDLPEASAIGETQNAAITLTVLPLPLSLSQTLPQDRPPPQDLPQPQLRTQPQLLPLAQTELLPKTELLPQLPSTAQSKSLPLPVALPVGLSVALPVAAASLASPLAPALATPGNPQLPPPIAPALPPAIPAAQRSLFRGVSDEIELPNPGLPGQAAAIPQATPLLDSPQRAAAPSAIASLSRPIEAKPDRPLAAAIEAAPLSPGQSPLQTLGFAPVLSGMPNMPIVSAPAAGSAPHDFSQLIDRLATARETAQPQAATLALSHADFGKVELHFANDGSSLSVTMASADPDFARAVQAAVPPVAASSDSNAAQGRQQGQGHGQNTSHQDAGSGQPQGQATGQNAARREPQGRFVAANPGSSSQDSASSAQDIFA